MKKRFDNDDPWAMAKLANKVQQEEASVRAALARRAATGRTRKSASAAINMQPDRFTRFKVGTCGNQIRWDHASGCTFTQIQALPTGLQMENGKPFVWGYAVTV